MSTLIGSCYEAKHLLRPSLNKADRFLTTYFETLNKLNCTEVKRKECDGQFFKFKGFTELVYDFHCDKKLLQKKCMRELGEKKNWSTAELNTRGFSSENLNKPCYQVALYENTLLLNNGSSFGKFFELKNLQIPFCEFIWCGIDSNHKHLLTVWLCSSTM